MGKNSLCRSQQTTRNLSKPAESGNSCAKRSNYWWPRTISLTLCTLDPSLKGLASDSLKKRMFIAQGLRASIRSCSMRRMFKKFVNRLLMKSWCRSTLLKLLTPWNNQLKLCIRFCRVSGMNASLCCIRNRRSVWVLASDTCTWNLLARLNSKVRVTSVSSRLQLNLPTKFPTLQNLTRKRTLNKAPKCPTTASSRRNAPKFNLGSRNLWEQLVAILLTQSHAHKSASSRS